MDDLRIKGPWSIQEIEAYINQVTIPMRLSVISKSGWPVVLSLWFLFEDNMFKCVRRGHAKVLPFLKNNPRCGIEMAGETAPCHGVRGQCTAKLLTQGASNLLERLADRYMGQEETQFRKWLRAGAMDEVAITLKPIRLMSWDYRNRMNKGLGDRD